MKLTSWAPKCPRHFLLIFPTKSVLCRTLSSSFALSSVPQITWLKWNNREKCYFSPYLLIFHLMFVTLRWKRISPEKISNSSLYFRANLKYLLGASSISLSQEKTAVRKISGRRNFMPANFKLVTFLRILFPSEIISKSKSRLRLSLV